MRAGCVGHSLRQAHGEADVYAIDGVADGRIAGGGNIALPARLVARAELIRLAHIVAKGAGPQQVAVDADVAMH